MTLQPGRVLLCKAVTGEPDDTKVLRGVAELRRALGVQFSGFASYRGVRTADLYACGTLDDNAQLSPPDLRQFEDCARRIPLFEAAPPTFARLECAFALPGAAAGVPAGFYYVVETDADEGWEAEMFRWYDIEHMPGLAVTPGCVQAQRFINLDRGPHSYACYHLTGFETLESAPWLAVRHSAWSDRVRPHFRNTLRTRFRALPDLP